jgi:hypothetical protein
MSVPIETTAVMDLTACDLDALVAEVCAYHPIYSPLFQRREQREGRGNIGMACCWMCPARRSTPWSWLWRGPSHRHACACAGLSREPKRHRAQMPGDSASDGGRG